MGLLDKAANAPTPAFTPKQGQEADKKVAMAESVKLADQAKEDRRVAREQRRAQRAAEREAKEVRPTGLPDEFKLAKPVNKVGSYFLNFALNYGLIFVGIFLNVTSSGGGSGNVYTWFFLGGFLMFVANVFVLPVVFNRNIGEFVFRIRYVNSSGKTPFFLLLWLNYLLTPMMLMSFILILVSLPNITEPEAGPKIGLGFGVTFLLIPTTSFVLSRYSETRQSLWEMVGRMYKAQHVPTGEEIGILGRLERLGDMGDRWTEQARKRSEERQRKLKERREAQKAAAKDDA